MTSALQPAVATVPTAAPADVPRSGGIRAWGALALLVLIGLYVVMDRQVFVLQIEPIRRELSLTDFQIGLLQGLSLALFASVIGYPIGWLADRFDRRIILAACIVVWTAAVASSAFAQSFTGLLVAGALVGAGEAGVLPIAYALIPELFTGRQRQLANSIFMVGGRFGAGIVIAACGLLVQNIDAVRPWLPAALHALPTWRLALLASALPGIVIVALVFGLPGKRAAPRTSTARSGGEAPAPPVLPFLRAERATFGSFYVGVGMLIFGFSAVGAFLPVVAMRQMGASALEVGNAMGAATFAATGVGLAASTLLSRMLAARQGDRLPITMLRASAVLGAATTALLPFTHTPTQLFVVFGITLTCLMFGAMTFPTALQDMTPAALRTRLVSIIIIVNTVFSAFSPPIVGALSDRLKERPDGLLWSMVIVATVGLVIAALALRYCERSYARTVHAARAEDAGVGVGVGVGGVAHAPERPAG